MTELGLEDPYEGYEDESTDEDQLEQFYDTYQAFTRQQHRNPNPKPKPYNRPQAQGNRDESRIWLPSDIWSKLPQSSRDIIQRKDIRKASNHEVMSEDDNLTPQEDKVIEDNVPNDHEDELT